MSLKQSPTPTKTPYLPATLHHISLYVPDQLVASNLKRIDYPDLNNSTQQQWTLGEEKGETAIMTDSPYMRAYGSNSPESSRGRQGCDGMIPDFQSARSANGVFSYSLFLVDALEPISSITNSICTRSQKARIDIHRSTEEKRKRERDLDLFQAVRSSSSPPCYLELSPAMVPWPNRIGKILPLQRIDHWSTCSSQSMCLLLYQHMIRGRRCDWPARGFGLWTAGGLARHVEKNSICLHAANPTLPPLHLHPHKLMTPDHPELARLGAGNHHEGRGGVSVIDPDYLHCCPTVTP
jgi:hypothetical protein